MLLLRPPGVYPPQHDTWLLADVFRAEVRKPGQHVLDICTGTGALAVVAALQGAASVTVVDVSRRALTAAWLNARARGLRVCARRGDLVAPVSDQRFDVILSNPPYVCAESDHLPTHGQARAWDGGVDGRAVLDRVCAEAPKVLAPGGRCSSCTLPCVEWMRRCSSSPGKDWTCPWQPGDAASSAR